MNFFCVYVKTRKKLDKFLKSNKIRNKIIIDIKKIMEEESIDDNGDLSYLKIIIFQKIEEAKKKNKDIYYVPSINILNIEKLLNIKRLLDIDDYFNVLLFYNEFRREPKLLDTLLNNIDKFHKAEIIRDF